MLSAISSEGRFGGRANAIHQNTLLRSHAPTLIRNLTPFVLNSGRLALGHIVGVKSTDNVLVLRSDKNARVRVILRVGVTEINLLHSFLCLVR